MKLVHSTIIAIALLATGPAQAQAPKIDLSAMKCAQFLQIGKEQSAIIVTWLMGYYTELQDPKIVDLAKVADVSARFSSFCTQNPYFGVLTAADGILGN